MTILIIYDLLGVPGLAAFPHARTRPSRAVREWPKALWESYSLPTIEWEDDLPREARLAGGDGGLVPMPGDTCADVAVIVVTWNSRADLAGLAHSLDGGMAGVTWRLVVVDNASTDDTVAHVRELLPEAVLVSMGHNAGYAAAINAGVRAAGTVRAHLVLNPDVRLDAGCAARLLTASSKVGVGLVVPRLVDPQGQLQLSQRREPSISRAFGEALLGGRRAGRQTQLGEIIADPRSYEASRQVAWATGAAVLVTAECAAAVGDWEESFFLYSEETDYALRARDAGYILRYCHEATAVHEGGEANSSPRLHSLLAVNRIRLYRRRHGRAAARAFTAAVVLNEALRCWRPTHRAALLAIVVPSRRRALLAWARSA